MSYLFKIENNKVSPEPEILLVDPFKKIWSRDKSKKKEKALSEFAYIEFMTSMLKTNPYRQYPEDQKHDVVKKAIIKDKKWDPDKLVNQGIEYIKDIQHEGSTSYMFYLANKIAAEKMRYFFENVDVNERNPKTGLPVRKPADIINAMIKAQDVLTNLKNLEKKVEEQLYESSRKMNNKEVSIFSDKSIVKSIKPSDKSIVI